VPKQFSLSALLIAVTSCAIGVALWLPYDWMGLLLALPHVAALVVVGVLIRRSQWGWSAVVATIYLSSWGATAYFGAARVRDDFARRLRENRHIRWRFESATRLNYDPIVEDHLPDVKAPWWFVGHEVAPCPFVVAVDYGWMAGHTNGNGGRLYVFWFFGYKHSVYEQFLWTS
jgi:hypothetical protein